MVDRTIYFPASLPPTVPEMILTGIEYLFAGLIILGGWPVIGSFCAGATTGCFLSRRNSLRYVFKRLIIEFPNGGSDVK